MFIAFLNILEMCAIADCTSSIFEKCILENDVYAICTCVNGQKIKNNQIVCHGIIELYSMKIFFGKIY